VTYRRKLGRLTVEVNENGARMHEYSQGCQVSCVDGWNDTCPTVSHTMSVEELRDLVYLLGRAIAHADERHGRGGGSE